MKNKVVSKIQHFVERVFNIVFTKGATGSVVITDQRYKHDAWFSYNLQFQAIMQDLEIDLLIDVGANEGQFAKQIRKYYQGEIYSFEPIYSVYEKLFEASKDDENWHVYNYALGSSESEQEINVTRMSVFSSLHETSSYSEDFFGHQSSAVEKERIQIRRLDNALNEIIGDNNGKRIFLKIDTQGHDLEVFRGVGSFGSHIYGLQSELSVIPIYKGIPHWIESIKEYEEAGFTVAGMFPVVRDSLKVIEYDCLFVKH